MSKIPSVTTVTLVTADSGTRISTSPFTVQVGNSERPLVFVGPNFKLGLQHSMMDVFVAVSSFPTTSLVMSTVAEKI